MAAQGISERHWPGLAGILWDQILALIEAADQLEDLRAPPGNRLEALKGNRAGQFSIRVNDQWRLCFRWQDGQALGVEIVDYH